MAEAAKNDEPISYGLVVEILVRRGEGGVTVRRHDRGVPRRIRFMWVRKLPMKVRMVLPGRKVVDVAYRCKDCGEEVTRVMSRAP